MTERRSTPEPVAIGVVGVGSMGKQHARVCSQLSETELVGVADRDVDRAVEVAREYDTRAIGTEALIETAEAVVIAVPTEHHFRVATTAIDAGDDVLVEKPLTDDPSDARRLIDRAERAGVTLATGHVERHNPAVATLRDIADDLEIIALDARRLGPPLDRDVRNDVVMDLMIHDLDVIRSLVDADVDVAGAAGARDARYVTAALGIDGDVVAGLTASRVTQQKVRELSVTAQDCRVTVDYMDRSVRIHRHSVPEYRENDGELRYRHESVVERPQVQNGEPLAHELRDFAMAIRQDRDPFVTGEDGLRAIETAQEILAVVRDEKPAEVHR